MERICPEFCAKLPLTTVLLTGGFGRPVRGRSPTCIAAALSNLPLEPGDRDGLFRVGSGHRRKCEAVIGDDFPTDDR